MAASHIAKHPNDYAGLFLLAAYPTKDLTKASFPVVFIYGNNDKVLNHENLKKSFALVPADYQKFEIAGGNHAGLQYKYIPQRSFNVQINILEVRSIS